MILTLLVLGILVLLAARVPIAVALLVPSVGYVLWADDITVGVVAQRLNAGVDSFALLAVPLFIMAGYAAHEAGVAERIVGFAQSAIGPVRGGLGYVNIGTGVAFSWMSGSATADAAGMGSILVPSMRRRGYAASFAAGLTGASATIGGVMPPSVSAIIYSVTAGVSIGGLFVAGIVPALLMALALAVTVFVLSRRDTAEREPRPPMRSLLRQGGRALPVLGAPVIVLGGILWGLFTPTEAAAVAVVYILVLGAAYRSLSARGLASVLTRTARTTAQIMFIVAAATMFGWALTREGIPGRIAEWMAGLTGEPLLLLLLINLVLLLVGMFLEPAAALLIMVPVLLPAATALGVDPLHLGSLMILNLTIGLLTPPVGLVTHILSAVSDLPYGTVSRGAVVFLIPLLAVLALITLVPQVVLWLPTALGYR